MGRKPKEYYDRIAFMDPADVYLRIGSKLNPYARTHSMAVEAMYPSDGSSCACGCEKPLMGRRTRWAEDLCRQRCYTIYQIIAGDTQTIYYYLKSYHGRQCAKCHRDKDQVYREDIEQLPNSKYQKNIDTLAVDHILPVKHGGGACWLSNYQLLCHKCHVKKTKEDFDLQTSI